jgi:hypothetical protein
MQSGTGEEKRDEVYREKHSMQQKEKSKTGPLSCGTNRPIKPLVKMGRSEVKPLISPSSELNVSSGSEEEDGGGKGSEDEADAECLYCVSLFTADHNGEGWVGCQKGLKWA